MKIILLQDEKQLGKKGEIIEASEGYARNYILPKKIGVEATPKNLNDLKLQKKHEEKVAQEQYEAAVALGKEVEEKKELFETYGFDLRQIVEDARANGREDVAKVIEEKIADFQKIYDFFSSRHTSFPDAPIYEVDPEELKNW